MSLDDILNMSAGNELDAAVAEKVMGFKTYTTTHESIIEGEYIDIHYCEMVSSSGRRYEAQLPNYSTYIRDAWIVAEKLGIACVPQSSECGFRWYACDLEKVSYRGSEIALAAINDSGISADTASEAICKAALLSICVVDDERHVS